VTNESTHFRWDDAEGPYAGRVWDYDTIEDTVRRYLRDLPRAEQCAARALRKPTGPPMRREAMENFLYILLTRPDGASRLVKDPNFEDHDARGPTLLQRSLKVAKRFRKLSEKQKAREHLLLEFESLLLNPPDEERNEKLAILCELLLDHPAEESPQSTSRIRNKDHS
jgi:hypothetical protein